MIEIDNSYYTRSRKEVVLELAGRGLTQQEIIKETGFPRGTVSSIMSKYKDEIGMSAKYKNDKITKLNQVLKALDVISSIVNDGSLDQEYEALCSAQQILLHKLESNISDDDMILVAKKLKQVRDARRSVTDVLKTKKNLSKVFNDKKKISYAYSGAEHIINRGNNVVEDTFTKDKLKKMSHMQLDIVNKFI